MRAEILAALVFMTCAGCSNGLSHGLAGGGVDTDGGDAGATSPQSGYVFGATGSFQSGGNQVFESTFSAGFADTTATPSSTTCTTKAFGACIASTCTLGPGLDAGLGTHPHAGIISVQGTNRPVALAPGPNGAYLPFQDTTQVLWRGGETISISALGGDVRAFRSDLVAPAQPTIVTPALPTGDQPLVVPKASNLSVSWTGVSSGTIAVTLARSPSAIAYATVTCELDAIRGSGSLPAEALQVIASGGGGTYAFSARNAASVAAGAYDVRVRLDGLGRAPDGSRASGAAVFQ
jgi:hypothetical protein